MYWRKSSYDSFVSNDNLDAPLTMDETKEETNIPAKETNIPPPPPTNDQTNVPPPTKNVPPPPPPSNNLPPPPPTSNNVPPPPPTSNNLPPPPPPPAVMKGTNNLPPKEQLTGGGRGALLDSIRKGKQLRKVPRPDDRPRIPGREIKKNNPTGDSGGSSGNRGGDMMSEIRRAMAQKFKRTESTFSEM